MSEYPTCFICTTVAKPFCYSIVKGVTKYSSTPFSQCLSQVLGDADCIVIAEQDVICENCHHLINEKDRISTLLAQHLRKKKFKVDYPIIEISTEFNEEVADAEETENFEDAVQITVPGQQENGSISPLEPNDGHETSISPEIPATSVDLEQTPFNYVDINALLIATPSTLVCDLCKATFQFKGNLIAHMKSKHLSVHRKKASKISCSSCHKIFTSSASFEEHLVPNIRGIENYCVFCECGFKAEDELKIHVSEMHQDCISEAILSIKETVKLIYNCMCCGSEQDSYSNFGRHRRKHRPQVLQTSTSPLVENAQQIDITTPSCPDAPEMQSLRKYRLQTKRIKSPDTSICLDDMSTPAYSTTDCEVLETDKKIFECGLCSTRLDNLEDLREHFKSHSQFKMSCKECELVMFSASEFKHHQSYHWKQGMTWKCNTCSLTCTEQADMISHLTDIHDHKYKCTYCGEQFSRKLKLVTHEKNHPESKKFVCSVCGDRFQESNTLKKHYDNNHSTPICTYCGTKFQTMKSLKKHECSLDPSRPILKCTYCGKEFKSRSGLRDHKLTHTGNHKFNCSDCGKQYSSKRKFEEHKNALHTENPKTLYTCETCGKMFLFLHSYINHTKKHKEPFSYICEHCGQVINEPGFVQVHLRKHTGERPFKCTYCPKAYTNGSYLRRHLMSHTKQYAYECQDCGRGFTDRKPFLTHREKEHDDPSGSETCDICKDMDSIGKSKMFIIHRHRVHGEPMPKKVTTVKLSTDTQTGSSSKHAKSKGKGTATTTDVDSGRSEQYIDNLDCDISQRVEIVAVDYLSLN